MKIVGLMFIAFTVIVHARPDTDTARTASANPQQAADTLGWKHTVVAGFTATQVAFSDWVQGGENALAWDATLDGKSLYQLPTYVWTTTYDFGYGNTRLGSQGTRNTDDKIDIASEFKYKTDAYVNPYVSATFKTQFATGYTYDALGHAAANSDFVDPAFLIQSAGAGYQPIPEVKTRVGAALREIITHTYTQYAGGKKTETEGGVESVTEVEAHFQQNLLFHSKIELFAAFKTLDQVVVRSDNSFTAKISKYFTTNINLQVIQERAISPRTQIKQAISLGFSYVLF
jgi:Protein of unknown function (DUF3078)/Protein of unknown function, DUF481